MEQLGVVIPAAGSGSRMNRDTPKPFIEVAGGAIIQHTVKRLLGFNPIKELVVATAKPWVNHTDHLLRSMCRNNGVELQIIQGGYHRQESVYKGLEHVGRSEFTAVHDAVRPFINEDMLDRCYQRARNCDAAILAVPVPDTVKVVDDHQWIKNTPERSRLWSAQTPQIFKTSLLKQAYRQAVETGYKGTDDASLVEEYGHRVQVVQGNRNNFKVTYEEDLERVRLLLKQ